MPLPLPAGEDDKDAPDDIPVVGRPSDLPFSGASGRFTATARAAPTTVTVNAPLTLTLTIKATGPVHHPPQRIDLREVKEVAEAFDVVDPPRTDRHPDDRTWEFLYQLQPRRLDVREVPGIPVVFYDPAIPVASKRFQVPYTDPIRIQVRPAAVVETPLAAPEWAWTPAGGPGLLVSASSSWQPGVTLWLLALLAPPLACGLWYRGWQRLNPDAARLAQQRRSRAAQIALEQLDALHRLPPEACAARAAAIVAGYLHQRLDLAVAEPTPREAAELVQQHSSDAELAHQAADFFSACDRLRFFPEPAAQAAGLAEQAAQLILALERESCPVPHS